ncbi:MAG: helix-turn-helix domain-containing protein [Caldilineaceae bacterium]
MDEQAWIQRGGSLDYDLTQPHAAWMVESRGIPDWPAPLLRFAEEQGVNLPYSRREEGLLLFWPLGKPQERGTQDRGRRFRRTSAGGPQQGTADHRHRPPCGRAEQLDDEPAAGARELAHGQGVEGGAGHLLRRSGPLPVVTMLGNNAEAKRFYRKTLGKLIAHDEEHNSELVDTLEGFFACHGNLSQTAGRLHIHRNTLTYRLERIAGITQMDLDDPDARFSLQLALKLRPVMK